MSDLIEEAGLDQMEERKLKYLKRALPWVVGATIVIVICMAIYNWRADKNITHNKEMGDMLLSAIKVIGEDEKAADEAFFHLIAENNGISDIARLEKAGILLRKGETEPTLRELENIADEAHNHLTKSYAKIMWMSIMIDQKGIMDKDKETFEKYLKSFKNDDVEFFGMAKVIEALFYTRENKIEDAKIALQKALASKNISPLVKDQAQALLSNLGG